MSSVRGCVSRPHCHRVPPSLLALLHPPVSDRNIILVLCLVVLVSGQFASAMVVFAKTLHAHALTESSEGSTTTRISAAVVTVVDTVLAVVLVILLRRRKTKFGRSSSVINRLIGRHTFVPDVTPSKALYFLLVAYTISTGLITAAWAFLGMMASIAWPKNLVATLVLETLPKSGSLSFVLRHGVSQ